MRQRLAHVLLATASIGCAGEAPEEAVGQRLDPVVYGSDDRVEYYAVTDAAQQALMQSTVVAVMPPDVLDQRDPSAIGNLALPISASVPFCDPAPWYANQPMAAICSGTLIDDDLVLTAGHCFLDEIDCQHYRLVFRYFYAQPGQLATPTANDVYSCRRIVAKRHELTGVDYAVVQLDRPVATGHMPAPTDTTRSALTVGAPIVNIGCGDGLPFKLDTGGRVIDPRSASNDYFHATPDAFAGASGMGVYSGALDLVGLLVRGAPDYDEVGGCFRVNVIEDDCTGADCSFTGETVVHLGAVLDGLCETGWPSQRLCGTTPVCGDGVCSGTETAQSCGSDCAAPQCGDGVCDAAEPRGGCAADCQGPDARVVPAEWSCPAQYVYAGRDGCDCECGAYDPDCNDPEQDVYRCAAGEQCSSEGHCGSVPSAPTLPTTARPQASGGGCGCRLGGRGSRPGGAMASLAAMVLVLRRRRVRTVK